MEIVLQNIGKQFKNGTRALDHVTFTIPQGEFVSVIGHPELEKPPCSGS